MRKLSFKKGLLVLSAFYALLIVVGLLVFRVYLKNYEEHHPVGAMNSYFADLKNGKTADIIEQSEFPFDAYNSQKNYIQYLQEKYVGGDLRWQYADMGEKDGALVYDVYADNEKYGTLYLKKQKNGSFAVRSDWAYGYEKEMVSPVIPQINGIALEKQGESETVTDFVGAPGENPVVSCFTVKTLLIPTITVNETPAVTETLKDGTVQVTTPFTRDVSLLKTFAETAATTYAKYISQDETYGNFAVLCQSGTPFLQGVRAYDNQWYNKHTSIAFENMQVKDPVCWSADSITVEVSFDFIVNRTYDSHTYPTQYKIALRSTENGYKIINISPM